MSVSCYEMKSYTQSSHQLIRQVFHRELGEKLRPLCKEQEQTIMVGVMNQRRLSRRLVDCMRYRRNGLTRAEEIPHFDQERHLRHNTKPVICCFIAYLE